MAINQCGMEPQDRERCGRKLFQPGRFKAFLLSTSILDTCIHSYSGRQRGSLLL